MKKIFLAATFALTLAVTIPLAKAQGFIALHQFDTASDGANPQGALLRDAAGNLYGTTFSGGIGEGVVFKIDSTGRESVLFTFQVTNGGFPASPLIQDPAGNLYGIADIGPGGAGILYKLSQDGQQTIVHVFEGGFNLNPKVPTGGLLMDKAGNIFGTTLFGGNRNCNLGCGLVYRVDKAGVFRVRYKFTGGADGSQPFGPLVQDADGNLYGVAKSGGDKACPEFPDAGCGTVFKLAKDRTLTVLHTFKGGLDGASPQAGLLLDGAGNLFGSSSRGGNSENGTVFRISKDGTYTVLHRFTGADGTAPNGGLVSDESGNLFGTTQLGGAEGLGIAFQLNPSGQLRVLHTFTGDLDGASPLAGLIRDETGHLFGTTVKNFRIQPVQGGNVFVIRP
jgi:uncharacterized repeat protein (TIGR03803 family)